MDRREWLQKAFERFKDYGCSALQARYLAEVLLEDTCNNNTEFDPVEAVNEEVSYWS